MKTYDGDRFAVLSKEGNSLNVSGKRVVLMDRETGVEYLFIQSGYAGGLTPLLDREGRPIIGRIGV